MKKSRTLCLLTVATVTQLGALVPASANAPEPAIAKASCAVADRKAAADAPLPEWPAIARIADLHGTAVVRVTLGNAAGAPQAANIDTSSGYASLDEEALRVARATHFTPALTGCRAQGGTFLFPVAFEK